MAWAVPSAVQLPRRGAAPRQLLQGYSWLWEAAAASPTLWRSLGTFCWGVRPRCSRWLAAWMPRTSAAPAPARAGRSRGSVSSLQPQRQPGPPTSGRASGHSQPSQRHRSIHTRGHVSHNLYFQPFPRGTSSFLWLQLFTECWDCASVAGAGLGHRPRGRAGHVEAAAVAGHDGTETTRGTVRARQRKEPSLPWHRCGQQLRNREPEQAPKRSRGSAAAGLGDTVAAGDAMRRSSSDRHRAGSPGSCQPRR